MTTNPYMKYYESQAGRGLSYYSGVRYQKGEGFFGRIMSGAVLPILKYLGRKGLEVVSSVATEVSKNPSDFRKIAKRKFKDAGMDVVNESIKRFKTMQEGNGTCNSIVKVRPKAIKGSVSVKKTSLSSSNASQSSFLSKKFNPT